MLTVGKKLLYIVIGLTATTLGILGIFLPGLPTVPFILLALWAFSNSSEYLHSWLSRLPILKIAHQEIESFQKTKSISARTKIIAQCFAWGSLLTTLLFIHNIWAITAVFLLAVSCTVVMARLPTLNSKP